ncbi:MAG: NAD-dependent epimerase/dehydratase family protein [Myxococcota bacterium]
MCVAITGVGSFAGARVAERLLDPARDCRVVAIDLELPRRLEGRVELHRIDLTDPTADSQIAEVLEKERCDAVLHAAFFRDPIPDIEYSHEVEVVGSLHVMNAAAAVGVSRLVVMSSGLVYGPHPDNPNYLPERSPLRPHPASHQARDRAEMETLLALFADRHPAISVTVLRPCWVIGPTIDHHVTRYLERSRVWLPLGYDPLLQFLHEDDLIRATEQALENEVRGPVNLAGEEALPISTLLALADRSRWAVPVPFLYRWVALDWLRRTGDSPAAFFDALRYLWTLDTRRAREELGFEPEYTTLEAWMSFVVSLRLRSYR